MKRVMGVVSLAGATDALGDLTKHRSLAAVPFGGRYRLIDFVLSNMVNSRIFNVAVFARDHYRALMDHLGSGNEWDLNRRRDGLFLLPPQTKDIDIMRDGDVSMFCQHLDYFERSTQDTVVLADSSMVYNMDLNGAVQFHWERQADVTVVYKPWTHAVGPHSTLVTLSSGQRITSVEVNPLHPRSSNLSLGLMVISKSLFLDLLDQLAARGESDLLKDGIIKNLSSLRVYGFPFDGYLARIRSLKDYYRCSMELLQPEVRRSIFFRPGRIYTKVINEPPTKYFPSSQVTNSLIANGCQIEGRVENSILFRGVKISKGAHIKDSIIMQRSVVDQDCQLENVILDKEVSISKRKNLAGAEEYPLVIEKRAHL